jgi:hypothetical protein
LATVTAGRTDKRVISDREGSHGSAVGARFERAIFAAHSLSDVLWEELRASAATQRAAELAQRIADLAATVAMLAPKARSEPVLIDEHNDDATERWWASSARRSRNGGHVEPPPWLTLIETALAQFERDRDPFAALLIEVIDAAEPAREQIEDTLARALEEILPVALVPESSHRYWLLVPRTDRAGATAVAEQLKAASDGDAADRYFAALAERGSRPRSGEAAPALRLVAGTTACPEDGEDVPALIARAHIELAQARSSSVPFAAATELTPR